MNRCGHRKFILSPIMTILQDAATACGGIGGGIETQSLAEYVLQTTFLKMTGASEQKLKCICWDLATNDYSYRYHYLKKKYGECSSYDEKCGIYQDLVKIICSMDSSFTVDSIFYGIDISSKEKELIEQKILQTKKRQEKQKNRKMTEKEFEKLYKGMYGHFAKFGLCEKEKTHFRKVVLFESIQYNLNRIIGETLVAKWEQSNYCNYLKYWKKLSDLSYADGDVLLCKELHDFYTDYVYSHRNRCAHNLISFQNNMPTLKTLTTEGYIYDNYYFRFSILILLDEIFRKLYEKYIELLETVEG